MATAEDRAAKMRPPPHNFESEMALLGAILINNTAYDRVAGIVRAEHFADKRHGAIFAAIEKLRASGSVADAVTLKDHFAATGELEQIGGPAYLARLSASTVSVLNAEDYARTVVDRALRRGVLAIVDDLNEDAYAVTLDRTAEAVVADAVTRLSHILGDSRRGGGFTSLGDAAQETLAAAQDAMRQSSGIVGIATGIATLDEALGGLRPGRHIVIGGRPGMGKSSLASNIAGNVASFGKRVAFFQLEMETDEMGALALAALTGISAGRALRGRVSVDEYGFMMDARDMLKEWPVFIDPTPGLSVAEIAARARSINPDLIVIDHLTLIAGEMPGAQYRGMTERTGATSTALKRMAKQLAVPVVTLCQLARPEKGKEDQRPQLEHLRWAGEIEQDADIVLLLYRGAYYLQRVPEEDRDHDWLKKMEHWKDRAEVILAKHRIGAGTTIVLHYDPAKGLFRDPDPPPGEIQPSGLFEPHVVG